MTPNPYVSTKNPSTRKSLRQFTETLDVKHKTAVCRFGATKENRKSIYKKNVSWSNTAKHHSHTKKPKFHRIPLPLDSTSSSDCSISYFKWLYLCLYWLKLQKTINAIVVIASFCTRTLQYYGESSRRRCTERSKGLRNNIIISDSTLQNILSLQLKEMTSWYKVMCGCECCISSKIMRSSLLSWHERFLNLKSKYVM